MAARLPQRFAALENAVVISYAAFTFRPAISPPAKLLQLIRRAQEKANVDNVRLPEEGSELAGSSWVNQ
jgi:hypothetical protein